MEVLVLGRKNHTSLGHTRFTPYGFILPAIISVGLVIVLPSLLAIYITLNDVDLRIDNGKFIFSGIKNFITLVRDPRIGNSVLNTLKYVVGCVSLETLLSLTVALLLNRKFRGKSFIRTVILIPMFITPVVVALVWRMFYDPTAGMVNYFLGVVGLGSRHSWLGSRFNALPAIMLADIWQWTPFMTIIIMAGLDSLPVEIYEAAFVDGASELRMIRHISLPLIVPAVFVSVTLRVIDALKAFDLIWVMTKGGPGVASETTNLYAYMVGFQYFRIGYATTIAFVFTYIVTAITGFVVSRVLTKARSA
jgi:multiple sugar transport system permease protein